MSNLEPLVVNHGAHIRYLEDAIRENAACQRATRRCLVLLEEEATTLNERLVLARDEAARDGECRS